MSGAALAENQSQALLERLDAARALLGVTSTPCENSSAFPLASTVKESVTVNATNDEGKDCVQIETNVKCSVAMTIDSERTPRLLEEPKICDGGERPRGGLDALAALASKEATMNFTFPLVANAVSSSSSASSSDDDSEAMPPPPPRRRMRSASNPEGMEKWDALSNRQFSRHYFVLPSAILEEELAEASAAMKAKADEEETMRQAASLPLKKRTRKGLFDEDFGTSPDSVLSPLARNSEQSEYDDEFNVTPEELLRRARSRLLEDLSEGNMNGDKGVVTLPHSLSKYKEVYNRNGRIGIYTPAERAAIIARFNDKRARRVWNKKIRYNCRKNLADRRLRVKGRFVKRTSEQLVKSHMDLPFATSPPPSETSDDYKEELLDEDMPDVNDPEAGFAPTEDQPYRRLRRHTIT